jgi:acetyl-CoA C-acetyltransferase
MGRHPYGRPWQGVAGHQPVVPSSTAAEQLAVARAAQDAWALRSTERALAAAAAGRLATELVAVEARDEDGRRGAPLRDDEIPRSRATELAQLADLPPSFDAEGTVTAGNSAPAADGAVAVLVADEGWARARSLDGLATLERVQLRAAASRSGRGRSTRSRRRSRSPRSPSR